MRRVLLLCLIACAPVRKPLGELIVKPVHELYANMNVVHDSVFRVESGRIVAAGHEAGTRLDLVAMDDGCLRGEANGAQLHICPAEPLPGDPKGLYRWHSAGAGVLGYATRLLDLGDKLRVEANQINVELPLPAGPTGDELRRHPELLGAAFAFGLFPSSADDKELWLYETSARP